MTDRKNPKATKPRTDLATRESQVPEEVVSHLPTEVVEALRQPGARIDINVILVHLVERAPPADVPALMEEALKVLEKFQDHDIQTFKKRADAVIDVKTRDPDEIEKRRNNRVRRCLKWAVTAAGPLGIAGAIAGVVFGAGMAVTVLLGSAGAMAIALAGMLASGESISSNDVVAVVKAIRGTSVERSEKGKPTRRNRGS